MQEIYLHVDLDGFDPEVAPGIVDDPVPGGLSLEDAADAIHAASQRFRMRAATVATFTPERDHGEKTLNAALRIIELVGEYASEERRTS